ncbi:MAG: cohesin domain-containing protein [Patescibacteria group bacterium]
MRTVSLIIVALATLVPVGASAAVTASLSLSPASGTYGVGDTFSVAVVLDTKGNQVYGADVFYLRYNPALLEVIDDDAGTAGIQITPGTLMPTTLFNTVNVTTGTIAFSQVTNTGATYSGSGTVATAHFRTVSEGIANVAFDFAPGNTADSNVASGEEDILSSVVNGAYTVGTSGSGTSPTTPAPQPAPSPAPTPPPSSSPTPSIQAPSVAPTPSSGGTTPTPSVPPAPAVAGSSGVREGALITGPDGVRVWIVNGHGYRRHIFNPAVFGMYGHFRWNEIVTVDQSTLDSYIISDLYQADGDPRVFFLREVDESSGKAEKQWLNMTPEAFERKGWRWEQVFSINTRERDYYQEGNPIADVAVPVPTQQPASVAQTTGPYPLAAGSLVKTADNETVYYITPQGLKKPIPNGEVFASYAGNRWANVLTVSQEQLTMHKTVRAIRLIGTTKTYLIDPLALTKQWVRTDAALASLGISPEDVVSVNRTEFAAYKEGKQIQ